MKYFSTIICITDSLNEMRSKLLNQNKETDIIDELLLKYINGSNNRIGQ